MNLKRILFFVFFLLSLGLKAQSTIWNHVHKNQFQPVKKEFKGLQKVYKKIFSSQDGDVCEFEISCSSYSRDCFKKYNFFQALFLTFDRLSRCNGTAKDRFYEKNESGKLIDNP